MAVTKEIVAYTSYKENGYEIQVHKDKSILVVCPPYKTEFKLEDIPDHRKEFVQPVLDHIEAEKNRKYEPATDEFED